MRFRRWEREGLAIYVASVVALLPSPHREALTLTELQGLTQKDAAAMLGVSLAALKSRVQRGRAKVRAALDDCCHIALDARGHVISCEPRPDRAGSAAERRAAERHARFGLRLGWLARVRKTRHAPAAMTQNLRTAFETELLSARQAEAEHELDRAWRHRERAHVLSQTNAGRHVLVHARMLAFGWRRRDRHEVLGQLSRIIVAAPGSWLGRAPLGNTGGANVGILTPMPIPEDLQVILAANAER